MEDRKVVIACATVIEEMLPLMPEGMEYRVLEFGLHVYPDKLRTTVQANIDEVVAAHPGEPVTILLGYGLCSQALVGVQAARLHTRAASSGRLHCDLPRFTGRLPETGRGGAGHLLPDKGLDRGRRDPIQRVRADGRTFREGARRAAVQDHAGKLQAAGVDQDGQLRHRSLPRVHAQQTALRFDLRYEEIDGSDAMVRKLLFGPWDDEYVLLGPGETVTLAHFYHQMAAAGAGVICKYPDRQKVQSRPVV